MAAAVGMAGGGAYIIGQVARTAVAHAQIERLASAAAHGYSESALQSATVRDPAILAIAREHDPYGADLESSNRQDKIDAYADNLAARRADPAAKLARISLAAASGIITPARPFRLRGALEESRDLECLTQAVYYEARGENADGQEAVAQVVLNRTRHPSFPKTVCGVVFQGAADGGCQFSFACDGSVHRRVETYAWKQAEKVAARALDGFVMAQVGNATHFHVASLSTNWGPGLLRVAQIGAHVFYRFGGRGGAPSSFTATPQPSEAPPAQTQQPVYASLSLSPLASTATTVATSVANSVAGAAELVMSAAQPKQAVAATKPADLSKPTAAAPAPLPVTTAAPGATLQPTSAPAAKADEPIKTATIS